MRCRSSVLLAAVVLPALAGCGSSNPVECVTVHGVYDGGAPQLILDFRANVNVAATMDTLTARYGFSVVAEWDHFASIPAPQPQNVLNGLRCEPSLIAIWYNTTS
jgi:hypothetical protein